MWSALTEDDARMAYEHVPYSRVVPQWFCIDVVKNFVLEPYEQHILKQML